MPQTTRQAVAELIEKLRVELHGAAGRRIDRCNEHVMTRESWMNLHEVVQRTHEERRRNEKDTRTRYLQRNKTLPQEHAAATAGAVIAFQRRGDVDTHTLQRRQKTEEKNGGNRNRQRERQHAKIQRRVEALRPGQIGQQEVAKPARECRAQPRSPLRRRAPPP